MKFRCWCVCAIIFANFVTAGFANTSTVDMLREMFTQPESDWKRVMNDNRHILDESFFGKVHQRIQWAVENEKLNDAMRFAVVGDYASEIAEHPHQFRLELAQRFLESRNAVMTEQVVDHILLHNPTPVEKMKAEAVKARLLEMQ